MQSSRNSDLLERPLTARSVIASLLLGMHPPRMAGRRLVQWCELFGVASGTARVALSRMVERGELTVDESQYELAGRVRSRQAAQDWSLEPQLVEWDTRWSMAIVRTSPRAASVRASLRSALRRCRYAELREGVWARPDNLPRESAPDEFWTIIDEQCRWWRGNPDGDDRAIADRLFATAAWAE